MLISAAGVAARAAVVQDGLAQLAPLILQQGSLEQARVGGVSMERPCACSCHDSLWPPAATGFPECCQECAGACSGWLGSRAPSIIQSAQTVACRQTSQGVTVMVMVF